MTEQWFIFSKVADCNPETLFNLNTSTNNLIWTQSTLHCSKDGPKTPATPAMESFVALVIGWKMLINATKSYILDVVMEIDTLLCFFGRLLSPACFMMYFKMCNQVGLIWCHTRRKRNDENSTICQDTVKKVWTKSTKNLLSSQFHFKQYLNIYIVLLLV